MKQRFCALLLILCAVLVFPFSALAEDGRYIYDNSGILSETQLIDLNEQAALISETHQCGVYIAVLDDMANYGFSDITLCAESLYQSLELGIGDSKSGVMLLLSIADRDYDLAAYGHGNTAFTDYGKSVLEDTFLDDFRDDDWYSGFSDYIETCGQFLDQAANGTPYDTYEYDDSYRYDEIYNGDRQPNVGMTILMAAGISCVISGVICLILKAQMKSVSKAVSAANYVSGRGIKLRISQDRYTHSTEHRVRIESESRSGGGGTTVNSSGFSHRSGKF